MPEPTSAPAPWWHRRFPSIAVFVAVLTVVALATAAVGTRVIDVLPEVGKDHLGHDAWTQPLGVERSDDVTVGRIPACAAGPVTRIVLWDANSRPYWEVSGPPTPITAFFVGFPPEGFTEITKYREPPRGAVLRLVVFQQINGVVGVRYKTSQLRDGRVVSGNPLSRFTVSGFESAKVCGNSGSTTRATDAGESGVIESSTTTPG